MKKFRLATCSLLAFTSVNCFAGNHSITAIARSGWTYKNNDTKKTTTLNSSEINVDYLKLNFDGKLNDKNRYTLELNGLYANSANDKTDNLSDFIEKVNVTRTVADTWTVSLGKLGVIAGGREWDYVSADLYTQSYFFGDLPTYRTGLTVTKEHMGQSFQFQVLNGNKDRSTGVKSQTKFGGALGYRGILFNGIVNPIIGYTMIPEAIGKTTTAGTRVKAGNDVAIAGGIEFKLPHNITFEADYNQFTEEDAAGTTTALKDLKTTSIVGLLRYKCDITNLMPFAKFIQDTVKLDSTKTGERTAYDLGIEYRQPKNEEIRYHAVYSSSSVKTNMNTTRVTSSPYSIMVGLRFDASILN
ncbi:MAG: porin [Bacteriovoracaceae bacterium]